MVDLIFILAYIHYVTKCILVYKKFTQIYRFTYVGICIFTKLFFKENQNHFITGVNYLVLTVNRANL